MIVLITDGELPENMGSKVGKRLGFRDAPSKAASLESFHCLIFKNCNYALYYIINFITNIMKKVEAVFRPEKLSDVKESLRKIGHFGMTITQAEGSGESEPKELTNRGQTFVIDTFAKVRLETIVSDENEKKVIDAIISASQTKNSGDGVIFVIPISTTYNITTGNEGL